jgi:hypothetical protein
MGSLPNRGEVRADFSRLPSDGLTHRGSSAPKARASAY